MYDMRTGTLTIRLDKNLDDLLTRVSRRSGRNRSQIVREALRRAGGNRAKAARALGVGRSTLYRYLRGGDLQHQP